jgi:hypothetical protein
MHKRRKLDCFWTRAEHKQNRFCHDPIPEYRRLRARVRNRTAADGGRPCVPLAFIVNTSVFILKKSLPATLAMFDMRFQGYSSLHPL